MLRLKQANFADAAQEYAFVQTIPRCENGFTNDWLGWSYAEFVEKALPQMQRWARGEDLPAGFVPESFYFLWDGEQIVGHCRIRHRLTPALAEGAGHFGYFIGRAFRGRGYATEALRLLLDIARDLVPEEEVFLRVNKDNPASLRVMLRNGAYIHHEDDARFYVRIPKNK